MSVISNKEKGFFLKLFNRSGYVLDFSTSDFDAFTLSSIGVALCEHYGCSKGRSLSTYVTEAEETDVQVLFSDLLEYYETYYQNEIRINEEELFDSYQLQEAKKYQALYARCREVIDRSKTASVHLGSVSDDLKSKFSSEYMTSQIDLMLRMRVENPTEAIGKSKELIESCCKTILEECGSCIDKKWTVSQLIKATMTALDISANNVGSDNFEGRIVKSILGSLHGTAAGIAELRNLYGSGHGKSASYKGLSVRHAKLAVGSSITLVDYLWDTFEWKKESGKLRKNK